MSLLSRVKGVFRPQVRIAELDQMVLDGQAENGVLFDEIQQLSRVVAELERRNTTNLRELTIEIKCILAAAGGRTIVSKDILTAMHASELDLRYVKLEDGSFEISFVDAPACNKETA